MAQYGPKKHQSVNKKSTCKSTHTVCKYVKNVIHGDLHISKLFKFYIKIVKVQRIQKKKTRKYLVIVRMYKLIEDMRQQGQAACLYFAQNIEVQLTLSCTFGPI